MSVLISVGVACFLFKRDEAPVKRGDDLLGAVPGLSNAQWLAALGGYAQRIKVVLRPEDKWAGHIRFVGAVKQPCVIGIPMPRTPPAQPSFLASIFTFGEVDSTSSMTLVSVMLLDGDRVVSSHRKWFPGYWQLTKFFGSMNSKYAVSTIDLTQFADAPDNIRVLDSSGIPMSGKQTTITIEIIGHSELATREMDEIYGQLRLPDRFGRPAGTK